MVFSFVLNILYILNFIKIFYKTVFKTNTLVSKDRALLGNCPLQAKLCKSLLFRVNKKCFFASTFRYKICKKLDILLYDKHFLFNCNYCNFYEKGLKSNLKVEYLDQLWLCNLNNNFKCKKMVMQHKHY